MDLPTQVQQERPVGDVFDLDAIDFAARADDRVGMVRVRREDRDVAHLAVDVRADKIDRVEQPARVGDRARETGERPRTVFETDAQRERERCGVMRDSASLSLSRPVRSARCSAAAADRRRRAGELDVARMLAKVGVVRDDFARAPDRRDEVVFVSRSRVLTLRPVSWHAIRARRAHAQ
jgi:hypothetical protein